MKLHLNETEQITLRDVFRTSGLSDRQIEDITLLLSFKRERVQKVFYLRAIGWTQQDIADHVRISQQHVSKILSNGCVEIYTYLTTC